MLTLALAALFALDPAPTCDAKVLKKALPALDFTVIAGARTLVASKGKLASASCGEGGPRLEPVLEDAAIDFRRYVPLPDGRLVFGQTGGLVVIDPVTLQKQPLTTAETYAKKQCWTADDGKPVLGWDRDPRPGGNADTIQFSRGGPCEYEGGATSTTMVVDLASGAVRPTINVPALVVAGGAVWLGDGGAGCHEQQTPGTLFVRGLDGRFARIKVGDDLQMGVVALAATTDGYVWALTGICDNGGARRGGNLYRARAADVLVAESFGFRTTWSAVDLPALPGDRGVDDGQAIVAIVAKKNELYAARDNDKDALNWRSTKDGKTWKAARMKLPAPKVPKDLAATLAVVTVHGTLATPIETWAWTDDGAFVRANAKDAPWRKAFP